MKRNRENCDQKNEGQTHTHTHTQTYTYGAPRLEKKKKKKPRLPADNVKSNLNFFFLCAKIIFFSFISSHSNFNVCMFNVPVFIWVPLCVVEF